MVGDVIEPLKLLSSPWAPLPNWLMRRPEVSAGAKLVYAKLAQYCGSGQCAFPLLETLRLETGPWSKRQIRRFIQELEELKLIVVERHKDENRASDYYLLVNQWYLDSLKKPSESAPTAADQPLQPTTLTVVSMQDDTVNSVPRDTGVPSPKDMGVPRSVTTDDYSTLQRPRDMGVPSLGTPVSPPRDMGVPTWGHGCPQPRDMGVPYKIKEEDIGEEKSTRASRVRSAKRRGSEKKTSRVDTTQYSLQAIGLANLYDACRRTAGIDWPPAAKKESMPIFEKIVELCSTRKCKPEEWIRYCISEYPKFANVKFPTPKQLTSKSMFEKFLVNDPTNKDISVHESVSREKKYEQYDQSQIELMLRAGLELPPPEPKNLRGRVLRLAQREAGAMPNIPTLSYVYHFHTCLLASTKNPDGLRRWIRRTVRGTDKPLPGVMEQWTEVVAFARAQQQNGHGEPWAELLVIADELGGGP